MDLMIAALLVQDGIVTGAIYAMLGMALVLVFVVTRVIFFPQGEFVAYGALTLAMLQMGQLPGTVWLLVGLSVCAALADAGVALRKGERRRLPLLVLRNVGVPFAIAALAWVLAPLRLPLLVQGLLAVAIIVPIGPLVYRLAYQPLADASVLVLIIVSVGVHFILVGLGLLFFGVEGYRTPSFWDARLEAGAMSFSGQSIVVVLVTLSLSAALWLLFGRTLYGKALHATSSNRLGARLLGISSELTGKFSFALAALIGAVCGILIAPIVTIYYDSGLFIGLKGFVAAIIGGLTSYPMAALGAVLIGLLESFSAFWASSYKEAIVYFAVVPVLLWLSLTTTHGHDEEE